MWRWAAAGLGGDAGMSAVLNATGLRLRGLPIVPEILEAAR